MIWNYLYFMGLEYDLKLLSTKIPKTWIRLTSERNGKFTINNKNTLYTFAIKWTDEQKLIGQQKYIFKIIDSGKAYEIKL